MILALIAAYHRSSWVDKLIMTGSVIGMKHFVFNRNHCFQLIFHRLMDWMVSVRGWEFMMPMAESFGSNISNMSLFRRCLPYLLRWVTTRFIENVLVEEMTKDPCPELQKHLVMD